MGKWTPEYVDDVLHAKVKNLVSGAIERSMLEKTEPTISYENFVKDLDTGDSFTTSLIDILVKELAERRTRPTLNDRRLIADRSAKSLRLLATPLRIYRDRSHGRYHHSARRPVNLTEYLTAPPSEMDLEEDEDIFESMLDNGSAEGARINSDLFDAYSSGLQAPTVNLNTSSPPSEDRPSSPPMQSTSSRSGPWSMPPSTVPISYPSSSLTRQPSIRRPARSRTVDFNDFTHRRRSSIREQMSAGDLTEPRENSYRRGSAQAGSRFFPFSRVRRFEIAEPFPWSDVTENINASGSDYERETHAPEPSVSGGASWSAPTPPRVPSQDSPGPEEDTEAHAESGWLSLPRLRRGGLRAPESMLSRHASPAVVSFDHLLRVPGDPTEPSGYPTPGSTDNETSS